MVLRRQWVRCSGKLKSMNGLWSQLYGQNPDCRSWRGWLDHRPAPGGVGQVMALSGF